MKRIARSLFAVIAVLSLMSHAIADVNILVIGSSASYSDGKSDPAENAAVKEKAFNPTAIVSALQSILANDGAISGSKNVVFEDIYRSKYVDTAMGSGGALWPFTFYCYSLMQYYMWPEGKANRLENLRGNSGTNWKYVVIMGDPYLMANMPGVYAEGVKLLAAEIISGGAEPILLAQWPENSSSFSASDFNEIVYRVGDSASIRVVPAGKAWDSLTPQDSSSSHPTPKGAYLAAASIYSELYDRSAKAYHDPYNIADHARSVVQANRGVSQYSGTYTNINVWQMKYLRNRVGDFGEWGTSTEEGFYNGLMNSFSAARVSFTRRTPSTTSPVDFSYSRGTDSFEADKQYDYQNRLDMDNWTYGFPIGDHAGTGALTMQYGIDKRYYNDYWFYNGTDIGVAYSMVMSNQPAINVRGIPVRLIWSKMNHADLGFSSHRDSWHLSNELDRGVGAFMYTLLSGRCPIGDEPADDTSIDWKYWYCRKIGYETAWQMSHLTTRAPGFQVFPSSATATNLTPTTSETLSVNFHYAPTSDVTVAVSTSDSLAGRPSPSTLTFTPQNYSNAQTVTVMGVTGSAGSHVFDITLTTSSADAVFDGLSDSWDFCNTRSAGPPPSDIIALGNGTTILAGDTTPDLSDWTDFGIVTSSVSRTFTMENTSASTTITFTGSPRADITAGSSFFTISSNIPVSSLAPSESTTFEVTYTPGTGGTHTAVVSIASTDAAVPVYTFTIGGLSPTQPIVDLGGAVSKSSTSAQLSGQLSGGASADAWICWGPADVGTGSTGAWENVESIGSVTEDGPFSVVVTGLATNSTYWYRCYVHNGAGSDWSDSAERFSGAAFGTQWTPAEITTALWLDADDAGTVLLNGGTVSNWEDKSGNDRHATQGTPGGQPTYTVGGLNGKNVLTFDGSTDFLNVDLDFLAGVSHSAFIVTKPTTYNNIYGAANGNSGANSLHVGFSNASNYRMNYWAHDWNGAISANFQAGQANILNYVWDVGSPKQIFANGASEGNSGGQNAGAIGTMAGGGRIVNVVGQGFFGGDIGEIIMITGTVSVTERQQIEGYLAHKWGLASRLPGEHPNISSPPGGSGTAVANEAASSITASSATLNGHFDATGTNYDIYVYYGTSDGGSNISFWASSASLGNWSDTQTNISHDVAGLIRGQTYFYTFRAGDIWATPSWEFRTPAGGVLTTNHLIPHTWIDTVSTNLITDYEAWALADEDGDGFSNWEEYWSGTDPNSSYSFLKIDAVRFSGVNVELEWQHSHVGTGIPAISIEATTNLLAGPWFSIDSKEPVNGTNVWSENVSQMLFYRLAVPNAP